MKADLKTACDTLDAAAMEQAQALTTPALPLRQAWSALVAEFLRRAKERAAVDAGADGRAGLWQVRVRLYREARQDEPEADSDPDLPADRPGTALLRGLPSVAEHLALLATTFHVEPLCGLEEATLRHRLKSLRPTISRRGGDAVWRVPYTAGAAAWIARVDIQRAAETAQ